MTMFESVMADDAANAFAGGEFSETVTYTPAQPSATNAIREISAVVVRDPLVPLGANPNVINPKMVIHVRNDATYGIATATLDTGGDTVTVAYRKGETAKSYRIHWPQNRETHDAAMITLELR